MNQESLTALPRFRMSKELQELCGDTTLWIVGLHLDAVSGFTLWGGGEPDRFLTVAGRLVIAPSAVALLTGLPPTGGHSFDGDEHFNQFWHRARALDVVDDDAEDAESGLFDFGGTLMAVREREVLWAPQSGMAVDCLGAALDLGRQYGEDSLGYRLARYGPLDRLYHVIWGDEPEDELDFVACEAALVHLIDWIECLTAPTPKA